MGRSGAFLVIFGVDLGLAGAPLGDHIHSVSQRGVVYLVWPPVRPCNRGGRCVERTSRHLAWRQM